MKKKCKVIYYLTHFYSQSDLASVKAHYYIGKIYAKQDNINDSILHFEQVLKYDNQKYYAGNALYEMTKIRIKQKDFYEAFFTLQRAVDMKFDSQRLLLYKDFTEGVLYLIKRQGDKGVEIMTNLFKTLEKFTQSDQHPNSKSNKNVMAPTVHTLMYNSFIYRAYGHLFNGDYNDGYSDLKNAKKYDRLDKASEYNEIVAKAILWTHDSKEYSFAHELLESAKEKFPDNKDPYLLQSLNIICKNYNENPNQWIDED